MLKIIFKKIKKYYFKIKIILKNNFYNISKYIIDKRWDFIHQIGGRKTQLFKLTYSKGPPVLSFTGKLEKSYLLFLEFCITQTR
jgi:hypothetical protein